MTERAELIERRLEVPLFIAAVLTIPAVVIEESNVAAPWDAVGVVLNWLIWAAFLVEVGVMLVVAADRRRWVRSHPLEVAIVLLTPPFLPAGLQAARVFRVLRILRLITGVKLARRLLSTEGVRDAAVLAVVTVFAGGAGFAAVEKAQHLSTWDGLWWAITTVTTVGYGDISPTTTAGRAIGIVVMLVGIGFVAILTAAAAERFMRSRRAEERELDILRQRLDEVLVRLDALAEHQSRMR